MNLQELKEDLKKKIQKGESFKLIPEFTTKQRNYIRVLVNKSFLKLIESLEYPSWELKHQEYYHYLLDFDKDKDGFYILKLDSDFVTKEDILEFEDGSRYYVTREGKADGMGYKYKTVYMNQGALTYPQIGDRCKIVKYENI